MAKRGAIAVPSGYPTSPNVNDPWSYLRHPAIKKLLPLLTASSIQETPPVNLRALFTRAQEVLGYFRHHFPVSSPCARDLEFFIHSLTKIVRYAERFHNSGFTTEFRPFLDCSQHHAQFPVSEFPPLTPSFTLPTPPMSFDDIEFSDAEPAAEEPSSKRRRFTRSSNAAPPEAGSSKSTKRAPRRSVNPIVVSDAESVALPPAPRPKTIPKKLQRPVVVLPAPTHSTSTKAKPARADTLSLDSPDEDSDNQENEPPLFPGPSNFSHSQYIEINREALREQAPIETLPNPPMLLIPHDLVLDGLLPPVMHSTIASCTTCATRGAKCYFVAWGQCCIPCKTSGHRCNFAGPDRSIMQTHERLQTFMSLSNHHLAALLYALINARRQADMHYQLALVSHHHLNDALNEFALGVFQLESALPQAAFAARWESPDTPERNPPSDPEMSRRDPAHSYYTMPPPRDDGILNIGFVNHPGRLPSARQVSPRTRAEAEASQPQPFNFIEAAPPRDGLSLSQIDRGSQGDEALIFDDNSESASVARGSSANASIRPPTPQVGSHAASPSVAPWRDPVTPHSTVPSSDPRQVHRQYAPPPHPPPQFAAQSFVPQQHPGAYQGPPRSMFAGPPYVPPDAPAFYGNPATGGHPGPRSAAPVVTAPVAPPTFTPAQLAALASASQRTASLTSGRGADSASSGQTSEGGAPSASMPPPPSPASQPPAPSHSSSAAGDAGFSEMQVDNAGSQRGDSGA
ncbi:hypothetical protein C8R44DRAFT_864449 [Mycena epipterygia]|nr:hypothetical protein C8R44DRAFT_864449 [Mycena epipterygia]